jgi:predicted P-loop ATPase
VLGLRLDHELRGHFAYNEMWLTTFLVMPLFEPDPAFVMRRLREEDVGAVQEHLQKVGLKSVGREIVRQAIHHVASEVQFHPIRGWIKRLAWDGVPRVRHLFTSYFGAPNTDYEAAISQMFLTSMVARVFRPGCKSDYMVVLEGPQGWKKSQACRVLGGEYFDDQMIDIDKKDASLKLRGKWILEWNEMRAYTRAEVTSVKAFLTRPIEIYRAPYGHEEIHEPRQCVFIGTTNQATYLTDETGGRRFWPIKISDIDLDALERDRDQLFAEAYQLYAQGFNWWPEPEFEAEWIKPQQEARFDTDPWEDIIRSTLAAHPEGSFTIMEMARGALGYGDNRVSPADAKRIKACMTAAGWEPGPREKTRRPWRKVTLCGTGDSGDSE